MRYLVVTLVLAVSLASSLLGPGALRADWSASRRAVDSISAPFGFERVDVEDDSFGAWLRRLPLRPPDTPVRLFDGRLKPRQDVHHAVIDLDVGTRDLQQCADAVIRLRAEFLRASGRDDEIAFDFTSGDRARWSDWREGMRPRVEGSRVAWRRSAEPDASAASFRRYLDTVFTYAGTASLERELPRAEDPVAPGDVFLEGGFPGHAVIVLDVAVDDSGRRVMLLAQSYMPAQDVHVLVAPESSTSPWVDAPSGRLVTPEWTFPAGSHRRF